MRVGDARPRGAELLHEVRDEANSGDPHCQRLNGAREPEREGWSEPLDLGRGGRGPLDLKRVIQIKEGVVARRWIFIKRPAITWVVTAGPEEKGGHGPWDLNLMAHNHLVVAAAIKRKEVMVVGF